MRPYLPAGARRVKAGPGCVRAPNAHHAAVQTFLLALVGIAMLATLGVLLAGVIGMARGQSSATSQRLMRYRVLFQFVALALFAALMMLLR